MAGRPENLGMSVAQRRKMLLQGLPNGGSDARQLAIRATMPEPTKRTTPPPPATFASVASQAKARQVTFCRDAFAG